MERSPSFVERYLVWRERRRPDLVVREHRRRMLAGLRGEVIEIGCGSGANFSHYPATLERVVAVEPDDRVRALAEEAAASAPVPVEVRAGTAELLPVPDAAFDTAVCCWVLCTVPHPDAALAEVRRVLRPGGELRFYEHVKADTPVLAAIQRAADATLWPRLVGGCETSRDSERAIREAGFEITSLERFRHSSSLLTRPSSPHIYGRAR